MFATPYSEETKAEAIRLRKQGLKFRAIAEKLDLSLGQVNHIIRKSRTPQSSIFATPETKAKARQLQDQGLSYKQIAIELGCNVSSVGYLIRTQRSSRRRKPKPKTKTTTGRPSNNSISIRSREYIAGCPFCSNNITFVLPKCQPADLFAVMQKTYSVCSNCNTQTPCIHVVDHASIFNAAVPKVYDGAVGIGEMF